MKMLLIGLMTLSLLTAGGTAMAEGVKHGRGHYAPRPPAHLSHHRPHHRPDYGHHRPDFSYRRPHHDHHRNHHDYRGAYVLGGLALGAVLADAFDNDSTVVYVDRSPAPPPRVIYRSGNSDIGLLRDRYGDCYEVFTNARGNEVRTEVAASECDW